VALSNSTLTGAPGHTVSAGRYRVARVKSLDYSFQVGQLVADAVSRSTLSVGPLGRVKDHFGRADQAFSSDIETFGSVWPRPYRQQDCAGETVAMAATSRFGRLF